MIETDDELRQRDHLEWQEANREAIFAYNEAVRKYGLFSDGLRSF